MRTLMLNEAKCAVMLRALAGETRLRLLESLLVKDRCVTELARELRRGQPHICEFSVTRV